MNAITKTSKSGIFDEARQLLAEYSLDIVAEDRERPWGGFFVLDENQIDLFIGHFFSSPDAPSVDTKGRLSPKILLIAPGRRLSWQYHHRRAELWHVVRGPVEIATSDTDEEKDIVRLDAGADISLKQGLRHRLIGMDDWGVVAEIWQHTEPGFPSDEDDIIRLQDDFGR